MRNRQSTSNTVLNPVNTGQPTINPYGDYIRPLYHDGNVVLEVECGGNNGLLYLSKLCQGSKGPCILYRDMWLTPNEFQYVSGRETAKDWKRSIRHYGKSMKLLLSKGILAVHPPVCDCTGCRISSPVNRNRLEEKLTPEQVNNGYCANTITGKAQTTPGMPIYGLNDYIDEIKELIKANKNNPLYNAVNSSTKKPTAEKNQKISTEVKKESRLTSIIDQLLINKTKILNQCDDKKPAVASTTGETTETENYPVDIPGFSGAVDTKLTPVVTEVTEEQASEKVDTESNQTSFESGLLLDPSLANKIKDSLLVQDEEMYERCDDTESNLITSSVIEHTTTVKNFITENFKNEKDEENRKCCSPEMEEGVQSDILQSTTNEITSLEEEEEDDDDDDDDDEVFPENADIVSQSYQLNTTNQHDILAIKTERVSPDVNMANCDLSTYSVENWTRQQMEIWTRNYSEFIRNLAKYSSLPTLQTCFLPTIETKLPVIQTTVDRQTHSSPPVYGESQSESGQCSNLVRTSSTSQLETYLRSPPKRPHSGEHRSDPLDLTVTTTKKSRIDDSVKIEVNDLLMSFDESESCDSKPEDVNIMKSTGTMRCSSVCTQQTCPDQSETVDVTQWNVDDVVQFVTSIESCTDYAEKFREHCIDGAILPLLTEDHLTVHLGMKLGPALKLRSTLAKLIDHCVICMHCIHCHGENQKHDITSDNK